MPETKDMKLAGLSTQYKNRLERVKRRVIICAGTACVANGAMKVHQAFEELSRSYGLPLQTELDVHDQLQDDLYLSKSGCQGFCQMGPLVTIWPDNILYTRVKPADVKEIVECTLMRGEVLERLLYTDPKTGSKCRNTQEIPFYKKQQRFILKHCGHINPEDIYEYLAVGGYEAASQACRMDSQEICRLYIEAGLRGRGGGGFLAGRKWEMALNETGDSKYIICNGDEGDPGAFMDRSVMEGNPHAVLEGMIIVGRAAGAQYGYVYVRTEYQLAVERMRKAVAAAEELGILGQRVLGTDFAFRIEVMEGAGAFVCGEETALMASVEGRRGMPSPKPPYPTRQGLFGKPTVINNVETLATVPLIMQLGSAAFRKLGTAGSPGTKTFAITGHVANTGLIEVPLGTTLREIIYEIAGGVTNQRGDIDDQGFKAVQVGGPSGACLTERHLDLPLDFDSLKQIDAMIGSGGLVVMNKETCMVSIAAFFMRFTQNESCGKCVLCREGTRQMLNLLLDIKAGKGTGEKLALLGELAQAVKKGSLCGLGKSAPNPVLSTLKYFPNEYHEHILHKHCPAGECEELLVYTIDAERCKGCSLCAQKCPAGAITGEKKKPYHIDQSRCIKCGVCASVCRLQAVKKVAAAASGSLPAGTPNEPPAEGPLYQAAGSQTAVITHRTGDPVPACSQASGKTCPPWGCQVTAATGSATGMVKILPAGNGSSHRPKTASLFIDDKEYEIGEARNLLEIIRSARIDIPTFCYHSALSVYGACRLCLVDIEKRGLVPSCSTPPEDGMRIKTNTPDIRSMRRIIIELLLANGEHNCTVCAKSGNCQLQNLANRFGVKTVRFSREQKQLPIDEFNHALARNPNKCVLCGDCVRVCSEVQKIGAIDFAYRGTRVAATPSFGKALHEVECVYCGQCLKVCPTGALTVKSHVEQAWQVLHNPALTAVVQIAPAVRIAVGEAFGLPPGTDVTGKIVAALRFMGFAHIYDTSFAADLTVIEEGNEFIERLATHGPFPLFTSCCPAWVKYAEQYYPEFLANLSTCRSPQQMFGALGRKLLPAQLGVNTEQLVIVSIMPCTAKKFEARRPEFANGVSSDVDIVLTTQELITMIKELGLDFNNLEPESFDLPLGFKSGAGALFGNSGGVTEAVLRYLSEKMTGTRLEQCDFKAVRCDGATACHPPAGSGGNDRHGDTEATEKQNGLRELTLELNGVSVKLAIVSGLGQAGLLLEQIKKKEKDYHLIEVMACPEGCIAGAGQPLTRDQGTGRKRARGLYEYDKRLQLHKAQENPYIQQLYQNELKGHKHRMLHTHYENRKRYNFITAGEHDQTGTNTSLSGDKDTGTPAAATKVPMTVDVCLGTSCFIKGAQSLLSGLLQYLADKNLTGMVKVDVSFCKDTCEQGPVVKVNDEKFTHCTTERLLSIINLLLEKNTARPPAGKA